MMKYALIINESRGSKLNFTRRTFCGWMAKEEKLFSWMNQDLDRKYQLPTNEELKTNEGKKW